MELPPWAPSVSDVGAQARARTKDDTGTELGTFTAATRPTGAQVGDLIAQAVTDVASVAGLVLPTRLYDMAHNVAVLGTAVLVELTYYPDQVARDSSAYDRLKALYDERLEHLESALGDDAEATVGSDLAPTGGFAPWGSSRVDWWKRW